MTNQTEFPMGQHQTSRAKPADVDAQKILIVDDEPPMQLLAASIIERLGHTPVTVASGEEAVEMFQKHARGLSPFSVVVMDLALPGGMSGLEATITIKQMCPDAKVIVSSGYLEQNTRGAALEHGFVGILPKPYTAERLASELRWVLKQRATEPEAQSV
ncbi:MAG: response regulator [Verrucomicrobiales bacterium]